MMGMLGSQAIPKSLLPLDASTGTVAFEKALGTLQGFSLIAPRHNKSERSFDLHRLVRLAMRNWLKMSSDLQNWTRKALVIVSDRSPPGTFHYRETRATYLPHTLLILSTDALLSKQPRIEDTAISRQPVQEPVSESSLQYKVAWWLRRKGDFRTTETISRDSIRVSQFSQEDQDQALDKVDLLRQILFKLGKFWEAEQMHSRALDEKKHALGENNVKVLRSKGELAHTYMEQGRLKKAEDLMVEVLEATRIQRGRLSSETVTGLENLAALYTKKSRFDVAEKFHSQAINLYAGIIGGNDRYLLAAANLATVYNSQGLRDKAEELTIKVLNIQKQIVSCHFYC